MSRVAFAFQCACRGTPSVITYSLMCSHVDACIVRWSPLKLCKGLKLMVLLHLMKPIVSKLAPTAGSYLRLTTGQGVGTPPLHFPG